MDINILCDNDTDFNISSRPQYCIVRVYIIIYYTMARKVTRPYTCDILKNVQTPRAILLFYYITHLPLIIIFITQTYYSAEPQCVVSGYAYRTIIYTKVKKLKSFKRARSCLCHRYRYTFSILCVVINK